MKSTQVETHRMYVCAWMYTVSLKSSATVMDVNIVFTTVKSFI